MLILFRRHEKSCPYTSREEKRCRCSIWCDWHVAGKRIRKPLGLRDWQRAQLRARDMEAGEPDTDLAPTVQAACEAYLKDAVAQNLKAPSLYKYKLLFRQLQDFATANGLVFISDFNLNWTRLFRESWTNTGHAAYRKLGYLRAFFLFAAESGWLKENYARKLKPPKIPKKQVMPFTREQFKAILNTIPRYPDKKTQPRLRALVLLLRYSGLRIADAATISRDKIQNGKLMIRTAKTGATVYIPLPPVVLKALDEISGPARACRTLWRRCGKSL